MTDFFLFERNKNAERNYRLCFLSPGYRSGCLIFSNRGWRMTYITEKSLAERWCLTPRTLRHWRYKKKGPPYYKIGGAVRYKLEEVKKYEEEHLRQPPG
jgi:hypothetical protein